MIGERSALLLDNAIAAVQQRRDAASATKAAEAAAAARPTAGGAVGKAKKAKAAVASKNTAASKLRPAAPGKAATSGGRTAVTPGDSNISPYLTADDLMGLSDATATADETKAAAQSEYDTLVANTSLANDDIKRRTVQNVASANDDAAARGLYSSGIRAGNVGMAQSQGQRDLSANAGRVSLAALSALNIGAGADRRLTGYQQGLAAKSAENGAALPVDPYSGNMKGVSTPSKAPLKKAKKKGFRRA